MWKWQEDGGVDIAGVKYALTPELKSVFAGAYRAFATHAEARRWLEQAAEAFRGGCAFYAGAARNVPALIEALRESKALRDEAGRNVLSLFQPAGLADALGDGVENFLGDARAIVERM